MIALVEKAEKRHTGLSPKKYYQESTKAYDFIIKQLDEKRALLHQDPDHKSGNRLTVALSYPEGYEHSVSIDDPSSFFVEIIRLPSWASIERFF